MGARRVIKWVHPPGPAPRLVLAEEALLALEADVVIVRVAFAVLDTEPLLAGGAPAGGEAGFVPEAAFVGTVQRGSAQDRLTGLQAGRLVVGVAPLADLTAVPAARVRPLPPEEPLPLDVAACLPIIAATSGALADAGLAVGDRVLVSGGGLTARLAAQLVEVMTGLPPQTVARPREGQTGVRGTAPPGVGEWDVLVEASGDPGWWAEVLPLVRRMGRVVLLIPPGPQVHSFDFYARAHRGSLTLLARRVPAVTDRPSVPPDGVGHIRRALDHGQVRLNGLLTEITVEDSSAAPLSLDALGEGQGLRFRFGRPEAAP